jgi:hypothetical protein
LPDNGEQTSVLTSVFSQLVKKRADDLEQAQGSPIPEPKNPLPRQNENDNLSFCLWVTLAALVSASSEILNGILLHMGAIPASWVNDVDPSLERAARLIIFHSWICVESEREDTTQFVIGSGKDSPSERQTKVKAALDGILRGQGVPEEECEKWFNDLSNTISGNIDKDAVIVNRYAMAKKLLPMIDSNTDTEGAEDFINTFFQKFKDLCKYFTVESEDTIPNSLNLTQACAQIFSRRFATRPGADFETLSQIYRAMCGWAFAIIKRTDLILGTLLRVCTPSNSSDKSLLHFLEQQTATLYAIKLTEAASLADLLSYLSSKFDCIPYNEKGTFADNLKLLLDFLKKNSHNSSVIHLLEELGKKSQEGHISFAELKKLSTLSKKETEDCEATAKDKRDKAYFTKIFKGASEACKIFLPLHGDTRVFFLEALQHASERWVCHVLAVARQERERYALAKKGAQTLEKVNPKAIMVLDHFRSILQDKTPNSLRERELSKKEIRGYIRLYIGCRKADCHTLESRLEVYANLKNSSAFADSGNLPFLTFLCGDDSFFSDRQLPGEGVDFDLLNDLPPDVLYKYVNARSDLAKAAKYKTPLLRHIDFYDSPIPMRFGTCQLKVRHAALTNHNTSEPELLTLTLWNGQEFIKIDGKWVSKRLRGALFSDAGLHDPLYGYTSPKVPLQTPMGRLAAGLRGDEPCQVENLYSVRNWAVSIRLSQKSLERISNFRNSPSYLKSSWGYQWMCLKDSIQWDIDFNIKTKANGPLYRWAIINNIKLTSTGMPKWEKIEDARGDFVRLNLSRLPEGTRGIGVDLGKRDSAYASIVVTKSTETMKSICVEANISYPDEKVFFFRVKVNVGEGENVKKESRLFRRIASDNTPLGTPHPSSWAMVEEQFPLELPGEHEGDKRILSIDEMITIHNIEVLLGVKEPYLIRIVKNGFGGPDKPRNQQKKLNKIKKKTNIVFPQVNLEEDLPPYFDKREVSLVAITAVSSLIYKLKMATGDLFTVNRIINGLKEEDSQDKISDSLRALWDISHSKLFENRNFKKLWDTHIGSLPGYKEPFSKIKAAATYSATYAKGKKLAIFVELATKLLASGQLTPLTNALEEELSSYVNSCRWG